VLAYEHVQAVVMDGVRERRQEAEGLGAEDEVRPPFLSTPSFFVASAGEE